MTERCFHNSHAGLLSLACAALSPDLRSFHFLTDGLRRRSAPGRQSQPHGILFHLRPLCFYTRKKRQAKRRCFLPDAHKNSMKETHLCLCYTVLCKFSSRHICRPPFPVFLIAYPLIPMAFSWCVGFFVRIVFRVRVIVLFRFRLVHQRKEFFFRHIRSFRRDAHRQQIILNQTEQCF